LFLVYNRYLGNLHFFLGTEVNKLSDVLLLTQEKYSSNLFAKASMHGCKSAPTTLSSTEQLSLTEGEPLGIEDSARYRSIVGALQYLSLTRSNLSFVVNKVH
jgi:histone deacetylase 1/2